VVCRLVSLVFAAPLADAWCALWSILKVLRSLVSARLGAVFADRGDPNAGVFDSHNIFVLRLFLAQTQLSQNVYLLRWGEVLFCPTWPSEMALGSLSSTVVVFLPSAYPFLRDKHFYRSIPPRPPCISVYAPVVPCFRVNLEKDSFGPSPRADTCSPLISHTSLSRLFPNSAGRAASTRPLGARRKTSSLRVQSSTPFNNRGNSPSDSLNIFNEGDSSATASRDPLDFFFFLFFFFFFLPFFFFPFFFFSVGSGLFPAAGRFSCWSRLLA